MRVKISLVLARNHNKVTRTMTLSKTLVIFYILYWQALGFLCSSRKMPPPRKSSHSFLCEANSDKFVFPCWNSKPFPLPLHPCTPTPTRSLPFLPQHCNLQLSREKDREMMFKRVFLEDNIPTSFLLA